MAKYLGVVRCLLQGFATWAIDKIPREENVEADRLSKFASIAMPEPDLEEREKKVFVEYLPHRSMEEKEAEVLVAHVNSPEPCWMDPVIAYLKDGTLPKEKIEAKRV